jgi:hypothetical protein
MARRSKGFSSTDFAMIQDHRILRIVADYGASGFSCGRRRGYPRRCNGFDALRLLGDDRDAKMLDDLATGYRENAEACMRIAEQTTDEIQKANWIKLAEEWLKLADMGPAGFGSR